jgi:hypothetical protein
MYRFSLTLHVEKFYCYYASTSPNGMRVSKFSHQENSGGTKSRGDKGSEQVLFQDPDGIVSDQGCLSLTLWLDHGSM